MKKEKNKIPEKSYRPQLIIIDKHELTVVAFSTPDNNKINKINK